jgi:hypothetical protein
VISISDYAKIRHCSGEGQGGCIVNFCLVNNRHQNDSNSDSCKSGPFRMQTFRTDERRYQNYERCFCAGISKNVFCSMWYIYFLNILSFTMCICFGKFGAECVLYFTKYIACCHVICNIFMILIPYKVMDTWYNLHCLGSLKFPNIFISSGSRWSIYTF